MKKLLSLALASALALSMTVPTFAAGVKSFSDVPSNHWAHSYIMPMVEKGLFSGTTTPDKNGVAKFSPDSAMTRGAFIAVVTKFLYPGELAATPPQSGKWWQSYYMVAQNNGLVKRGELDNGNLDAAMSREEMALVLSRVAAAQRKSPSKLVETSAIPDWNSIGSSYQDGVRTAYSMGLLAGVDTKGTFNPKGVLNRAQASTVIYKLVNLDSLPGIESNNSLTEKEITNEWDGKGVNISKFWDPADPLAGMPNTAAVAEKYGAKVNGYGYAVAMKFVNIDNSIIENGLVLNGFGYSSVEPDRYDTAIAMLKDVLDAESANALIGWIEKLDDLHNKVGEAFYAYGRESTEYITASKNLEEFYTPIMNEYSTFGNVKVQLATSGNNVMFYILNK